MQPFTTGRNQPKAAFANSLVKAASCDVTQSTPFRLSHTAIGHEVKGVDAIDTLPRRNTNKKWIAAAGTTNYQQLQSQSLTGAAWRYVAVT